MNNILISIIIPVYNTEKYLVQCVNSVLSQKYGFLDVILVDDGSTDSSGIICDSFSNSDDRVQVIHKQNGGLSDARNVGIQNAKGEYCTFMDSDDFYENDYVIERLVYLLDTYPDFVMSQFKRCDENVSKKWDYYKKEDETKLNSMSYSKLIKYLSFHDKLLVSACCKLVKKSLLIDKNIMFVKNLISEDVDWFLHLLHESRSTVFTNDSGYIYRIRDGSITHRIDEKPCKDLSQIIQKWMNIYLNYDDDDLKAGVLSLLAYEYYILLGGMYMRNMLLPDEGKEFYELIRYSKSRKTRICKIVYRCLGQKTASRLFAMKVSI